MDVKFNAAAAEQLIQQMGIYCSGIQNETRDVLDVLKNSGEWNDNQMRAFQNNMAELAKELNKALSLESEYMRTFYQRVNELRG